jgi:alkylhydroperoxidase family enzyme
MARVPYVDREDLSPELRHLAGSQSNITRAMSNSPNVAYHSGTVARYIRTESPLDPRLRELAIVQVGYAAGNAYEYAHHVRIGLACGVTDADMRAIADETAGRPSSLPPLDRAVLRAAREMTLGLAVTPETFAELKAGLDDKMLVELIFAIANYNGVVRFLASLEIDLEEEYRSLLAKYPLPTGSPLPAKRGEG